MKTALPSPRRSTLTAAELKAAFRARKCARCGAKFSPIDRTENPSTARRMKFCGVKCKRMDHYEAHRETYLAKMRSYNPGYHSRRKSASP